MLLHTASINEAGQPFSFREKQSLRHACIAGLVGSWDGYVNNIVSDFLNYVADPLNLRFSSLHTVAEGLVQDKLKYFNTPNWEISRGIIIACTGYDPIADWVWPRRRMGVIQVQTRLNETLKVRHSFAHGFSLPAVDWLKTTTGKIQINKKAVLDTRALFDNLAIRTDNGMKDHMNTNYGTNIIW